MKKHILIALAVLCTVTIGATAASKAVALPTMPTQIVGEWCKQYEAPAVTDYVLPSWAEDNVCTGIVSIDQYGVTFDVQSDNAVACYPIAPVRIASDTAPSGTSYSVVLVASCHSVKRGWPPRVFKIERYKGSLSVTEVK